MKKIMTLLLLLLLLLLAGCSRLVEMKMLATEPEPVVVNHDTKTQPKDEQQSENESGEETAAAAVAEVLSPELRPNPVQVKGIYISAYVAGEPKMIDELLVEIDKTEINTLVIDLKDDLGRVVCKMDSPQVKDLGAVKVYVSDMEGLLRKLKEHNIYAIARIPAFRDSWLGEQRPEWCIQNADGSVFQDRDKNAWVNPYKREAWDYLIEIGVEAKRLGFDEIQFDYVRFCTEKSMQNVVFDQTDVQGLSRTEIISEFVAYAYDKLRTEGLFVSADVFGAIIDSGVNADSVGQIYGELAKHLDYISPMIYPSHYGDGNYGIDYPDMHPYETITAALAASRKELHYAGLESEHIAIVRPWLQDFTATWLTHHISYTGVEVRKQIQATYDSGYDEWMLWDASCKYEWAGLLTPAEAAIEANQIRESRAALPEPVYEPETTAPATTTPIMTAPAETVPIMTAPVVTAPAAEDSAGTTTTRRQGM